MEADHEATEEAVDELIATLSPEPTMQDPSRRRTEIYTQGKDFRDHIKLRDNADDSLTLIAKLQREAYERTDNDKTEDKVDKLIAANAATQATISAMAAENASIKTLLTQLLDRQATQHDKVTEKQTELKIETETEPKHKLQNDQTTKLKTDLTTEMEHMWPHMGVLRNSDDTVMYSHDISVTALFTELENLNALQHTDYLHHCDTDQRRTVDFFSLYLYFTARDQGCVIERIEKLFGQKSSAHAYKAHAKTLIEEFSNFSNPAHVVKCDFGLKVALGQIGPRPRPNANEANLIDRAKEKDKQKEKY